MKNTLLLVFVHGFKGNDRTFHSFPQDLRALIAHTLPKINVVSVQYPQYETKGDLRACVSKFKEWLQNKVIDLEVANRTPSPTVDPSVHVILCGHSMGGIVAAEALLSIAGDAPVPPYCDTDGDSNSTAAHDAKDGTSPPPIDVSKLFFPYIEAILAFDTPFLGLNPGIIAHGAEENGTSAYNAFNAASSVFGWGSPTAETPSPSPDASSKGLPSPSDDPASPTMPTRWLRRYAMYGGAAAALAGVAGATYYNWNHINNGLSWAGSHLEFVGCLARGAELQKRVEKVVQLEESHDVGFTIFYGALGEKTVGKTKYAETFVDADRTFCVVPSRKQLASRAGTKRTRPSTDEATVGEEMEQGEQVQDFVQDVEKRKGRWVKCVNQAATDEITAHTTIFAADKNPDYHSMVPRARDQIVEWIGVESDWYLRSDGGQQDDGSPGVAAGAEESVEEHPEEVQDEGEDEDKAMYDEDDKGREDEMMDGEEEDARKESPKPPVGA
ncbi:uncharacterized protein RCC_04593 [Ramularia collo-cygni]|uniref:AB hydrolase-1 domain-containing protein n=1 Tax=Ramularia collo-cygni TaxID=112498 RepID=A0A2D3VB12_9PEZI|nr:uncharacterized protein RCC_04593 [Ramularia collo-cygni]CZT18749.1 uncharacterized protein RCC_04593 [Ramularia collo-cygni]